MTFPIQLPGMVSTPHFPSAGCARALVEMDITIIDASEDLLARNGIADYGVRSYTRLLLDAARANLEQPELVVQCHLESLRAGATVITTLSHGCVPAVLDQESDLCSVRLAKVLVQRLETWPASRSPPMYLTYSPLPSIERPRPRVSS